MGGGRTRIEDEQIQADIEKVFPGEFAKYRQALSLLDELFEPLPEPITLNKLQEVVFAHTARAFQLLHSILLLARFGYGLDCIVLVRSLVELTINSYFLAYEKKRKALYRYVKYGRVEQYENFRQLLEFQNSHQRKPTVDELVGKDGARILRSRFHRSKKAFIDKKGRIMHSWCSRDLRQRARFVDNNVGSPGRLEELYVIVTKQMGNPVTHASALGLSQIPMGESGARFDPSPSKLWVRECVYICLACVFLVAQLANIVGKMNRNNTVRRIEDICRPEGAILVTEPKVS